MIKLKFFLPLLLLTVVIACKNDQKKDENSEVEVIEESAVKAEAITLELTLEARSESTAEGVAYFSETNGVVNMSVKLSGLDPGTHAIHIHEKADCSSADATSSGGHWNPTFAPHGKWGDEGGYHKGDIGNFEVGDDGIGTIVMDTDEWCIGCGDETKDILGKAVVVHQDADDFTSQPSGAAGARISCAGIIQ